MCKGVISLVLFLTLVTECTIITQNSLGDKA